MVEDYLPSQVFAKPALLAVVQGDRLQSLFHWCICKARFHSGVASNMQLCGQSRELGSGSSEYYVRFR